MPTLTEPQARFLALPHKFKAYVAGYRAGKTWAICADACRHMWEHPKINRGYFAPTYPQIRDIYFPTIEEVAHDWGLRVQIAEVNKEVHFYSGRTYRGTEICRSLEKPEAIIGFKIGVADVDEIDTLPERKAENGWRKVLARLSLKFNGRNGANIATTPEGYRFTYRRFVKSVRDDPKLAAMYGLVQASTYDNAANLPDDYIPSLLATYPAQLIDAYLRGKFVNLTQGTVYNAFDRVRNGCGDEVEGNEPVHIGMDFNVGKMAAIVHVVHDNEPRAVDEIEGAYDTPDMIRIIQSRYGDGRTIHVYPDPAGASRDSANASKTDMALLRDAGFHVVAPKAHDPVKDRVNSMNAMFCNAEGLRRYKVNINRCQTYADHLEQQVWAPNGQPDKTQDIDHDLDAAGYYIMARWPIVKPARAHAEVLRL